MSDHELWILARKLYDEFAAYDGSIDWPVWEMLDTHSQRAWRLTAQVAWDECHEVMQAEIDEAMAAQESANEDCAAAEEKLRELEELREELASARATLDEHDLLGADGLR